MIRPAAGFDFTFHAKRLCDDMACRLPELAHVRMDRVAVSFCQTRKAVSHGMYASLTPLRFENGSASVVRGGEPWTVQRTVDAHGREMLYILNFYLPRFLNLSFDEKLTTVVHELWHISPRFDGDIRRFKGRFFAHGESQRKYDAVVTALARRWLSLDPPKFTYEFLHHDYKTLRARHGRVYGTKVPAPKLIRAG